MPTPTTIRAAMGTALRRIPGLVVHSKLTEVTTLGAGGGAVVGGPTASYHEAMARGNMVWNYPIYVLAPAAEYDATTDTLDELVSPYGARSIPELFWNYGRANGALGQGLGVVDSNGAVDLDAYIDELVSYGATFDVVGIPHLGAILNCVVRGPGRPT